MITLIRNSSSSWCSMSRMLLVLLLGTGLSFSSVSFSTGCLVAQEKGADGKTAQQKNDETRGASDPDSEFKSAERAWEYDPYQVKIWICNDRSSFLNSNMERMKKELEAECVLVDPSGWRVVVEEAPLPWNWRLLNSSDLDKYKVEMVELPEVIEYDKLICARIRIELGRIHYDVQELDVKTQQWGARNVRVVGNRSTLVQSLTSAISQAFMPLAKIDKVVDKKVKLRVRASGLVQKIEYDADGDWQLLPNLRSPVSVIDEDVFLPVVRRLDRDGKLEAINRIEWTYLSIVSKSDVLIECTTHAKGRAPLAGRVGRRTQRFALVIRAPNRKSILKLVSKDKDDPRPLPGLEVYSRPPDATPDEESDFLGYTDWRGTITIPPNTDSMRVLYIKSGMRPLARLPVIPGFFDLMTSPMPDDEKRLYAEGIVTGLSYELMDLVAQRKVIGAMVESYLDSGKFAEAQQIITELRGIDNSLDFNTKLGNEIKRLQSTDRQEAEKISAMFQNLQELSDEQLTTSLETLLARKLAVAKDGGEWRKVTIDGTIAETGAEYIEDMDSISDQEDVSTEPPVDSTTN